MPWRNNITMPPVTRASKCFSPCSLWIASVPRKRLVQESLTSRRRHFTRAQTNSGHSHGDGQSHLSVFQRVKVTAWRVSRERYQSVAPAFTSELPRTRHVRWVTLTSFPPPHPPPPPPYQQHLLSFLYTLVFYKHTAEYFVWIHSNVMLFFFFWHLYSVSCKNWDSHTDGLLDFHSSLSTTMGGTFCPFIALTCQLRDERKERM